LATPTLAKVAVFDPSSGQTVSDDVVVLVYLAVANNDLIYDATRSRIYVSVSQQDPNGPALGIVDPNAGFVERYIPLPAEPGLLALTADAGYLYISMADRIRRMDLTGATADLDIPFSTLLAKFPPPSPPPAGWFVRSLIPLAAQRGSFVVSFYFAFLGGSGPLTSVAMVVDGSVARSGVWGNAGTCLTTLDQVTFYTSPGLTQNAIDSTGFGNSPVALPVPLAGLTCPAPNAGLLYGSTGAVIDPKLPTIVDWLAAYGEVDLASERAKLYCLDESSLSNLALDAFDLSSRTLIQSLPLPTRKYEANGRGGEGRLIHWGTSGIAFGDYSSSTSSVASWLYIFKVPN
jgi:hypothetical protein